MKISDIDKIKEKSHIVLLQKKDSDIKESIEYSFDNVIFFDSELTEEDAKKIIDVINKKNIQLILVDYDDFYRLVIPYIHKDKKIKWIIKNGFAAMTNGWVRAIFTNLMEFCDRNMISCIGCLNNGAYEVLKNAGYNAKKILLDIKEEKIVSKNNNSIGVIGDDANPNQNIYNELTAVTMVEYDYIKILKTMPATNHFIEFFNIKEQEANTLEEVIKDNFVNLYCNFTTTNTELILKSMDLGVPCILGNTDIFDDYELLKKYLVLKSDDDVNEIANKIMEVKKNYKKIIEEYKKFRKEYIKKSKESIEKFITE